MTTVLESVCQFFLNHGNELTIGAVSSVAAALVLLAAQCCVAWHKRCRKSRRFVGIYKMLDAKDGHSYCGSVAIKRGSRIAWLSSDALLNITARHANEVVEWKAVVEVLGYSGMASGFFQYADHTGGALRLMLSDDRNVITEHGTPHKGEPFTNLFKRVK
jgi:hypothetical protein